MSFASVQNDHPKTMLKAAWNMLNEADVVVHYNGKKFDIPILQQEFALHGLTKPAPYKQVDLLRVVREEFRFPSNKLEYVANEFGLGGKVKHKGMQLWKDCMSGCPKAWGNMEKYNKGDVLLLEKLYNRLVSWVPNHPSHALYSNETRPQCTNCGGISVQRRGDAKTKTMTYPRYVCRSCGTWLRGLESDKRKPKLVQI